MSQCSPDSNQGCYSCVSGGMTTEPHTHRQAGRQATTTTDHSNDHKNSLPRGSE